MAHCPPALLATGSYDGEIIVWNVVSGCIVCRFISPPPEEDERRTGGGDLLKPTCTDCKQIRRVLGCREMERDLHSYIYCGAGTLVCLTQSICMGLAAALPLTGEFMLFSRPRQFKSYITYSAFSLFCHYCTGLEHIHICILSYIRISHWRPPWSCLLPNLPINWLKASLVFPSTSHTGNDCGVLSVVFLKECKLQQFSLSTALVTSGAKGQL